MTASIGATVLWMIGAYLAGSIPFGWLIGKARGVHIRVLGSRNIGATNCGRVCGWPWGVLAFALDVAKGAGPVLAAVAWLPRPADEEIRWLAVVLVAAQPILGHLFPLWLGFRGGKAVATSLGVLLAFPMLRDLALAALGVWGLVVLATRYVSVASSVAALAFLAGYLYFERAEVMGAYLPVTVFVVLLVAVVLIRHRANYGRLM
ncbi:MAG TPA: glycerol-3-phosphate acyltransferase, partial [Phycisphaerae bacterium]|nr:glycerol-3-phosphate acyltransferase [Phycisphaerae bacterium]